MFLHNLEQHNRALAERAAPPEPSNLGAASEDVQQMADDLARALNRALVGKR
ncbi:MAG: hypothetical protein ACE5Q6_07495 [Dehalococcoidia bacterium]